MRKVIFGFLDISTVTETYIFLEPVHAKIHLCFLRFQQQY